MAQEQEIQPQAGIVFEVSWEVCNKIGGIFTVVQSKAQQMVNIYGRKYFLLGPYFPQKASGIFEETIAPAECKEPFDKLRKDGIECHCGRWLTKGNPLVILIDFTNFAKNKNDIKRRLWELYGIDSLYTEYYDFDEPVIWSWAAGKVIEELAKVFGGKVVAQFHEWLSGAGLLYLKSVEAKVGTVFTTHATTLGRALASERADFYDIIPKINAQQEARARGPGLLAKHQLEQACAKSADVFSTVSELTAMEAEHILGRKADLLLPNGLDMEKFPTFEEASVKHKLFNDRIRHFILFYFFPYYRFEIKKTLIYFLAGRYEFHDKGVDIFIKALSLLNERLKKEKSPITIVAFFWIPGNAKGIKPELLENKTLFGDIKDSVDDMSEDIRDRILYALIANREISKKELFSEEEFEELRIKTLRLLKKGKVPISTHDLYNEESDLIINSLKVAGLTNEESDRVKVVFYPIYLTGADGLLDTTYYESMLGSHLGIFPSFYEPWGYTPLEAAALGVSSVTTDLSGFGRYICTECEQGRYPGVFVLKRYKRKDEDVIKDLANFMYDYAHMTPEERTENKFTARMIAATADWRKFIRNYIKAHNLAIEKSEQ